MPKNRIKVFSFKTLDFFFLIHTVVQIVASLGLMLKELTF